MQPEAVLLLLDAAGPKGMRSIDIYAAAPDKFRNPTAASGAVLSLFENGKVARSAERKKIGFMYWLIKHAPPGAEMRRSIHVRERSQPLVEAQPAPLPAPVPAPQTMHAAAKIAIREVRTFEVEIGGQVVRLSAGECAEIGRSLLTLSQEAGRIA